MAVLALLRPRCKKLTEFVDQLAPFFVDPTSYDADGVKKHLSGAGRRRHVKALRDAFARVADWTDGVAGAARCARLADSRGVEGGYADPRHTPGDDRSHGESGTVRDAGIARP